MNMLFKKILNMAMCSILLISQISLAAIHSPPSGGNPGSLQFDNVLVDASSNISATLTATDDAPIYAGQKYTLNPNLGPPSGSKDSTYHSLTQLLEAQEVMETATQKYDVTLQLTQFNIVTNTVELTITELRSKMIGDDNQLVEQITTFMPGPQGDKGDQGEKGDTGSQGPKGSTGATGPQGGTGPAGPKGATGSTGPIGPAGTDGSFPMGNAPGDMQYWNGAEWVIIPLVTDGNIPQQLTVCDNVPRWIKQYQIGDTGPAGGIVFHTTVCGGLEAASIDQGTGVAWGCFGTEITGADGTVVGTGAQNTADILAGCAESPIVAELADNYSLNSFNDWFLPSKDELNLMYINLHLVGLGGFANANYWGSTEVNAGLAWAQSFSTGDQADGTKSYDALRVRAVRAFNK